MHHLLFRLRFVFLLVVFSIGVHRFAIAADFSQQAAGPYGPVSVSIKGDIKDGDFDRFRDFLLLPGNLKAYTNYVWLDSRGGSLFEAMKFSNLFEKSSASVVVGPDAKCYSACFSMFAGGVDRVLYPFGELGVHQISANHPEIDTTTRQSLLAVVAKNVYAYLLSQGMPQAIIDKMRETPAASMYILDSLLLKRNGWNSTVAIQPAFLNAVEKTCGPHPAPQKSLLEQQRDDDSPQRMAAWTACRISVQTKNAMRFAADELALLESGQPSLLFPAGKLKEATAAMAALQ